MSTYGGDKRRPKADRYFDGDETQMPSLNERSYKIAEHSESTAPDRVPSKKSNRVYRSGLGNAGKASIARQLDQIKVSLTPNEPLSIEDTATHSRKVSRFGT